MALTHGTPAHLACAAALLAAGADWLAPNRRGDTPLHAAARAGRAGALRFLLAATVRVGPRPARLGAVVVHAPPGSSASPGRVRLVDARTAAGLAPLDLAVLAGSAPAVAALLAAGADGLALLPRAASGAARAAPGSSLLHLAAARGLAAVAGVLVDAGTAAATRRGGGAADLRSVRDAFGRLPARVAAGQGFPELARSLAPPPPPPPPGGGGGRGGGGGEGGAGGPPHQPGTAPAAATSTARTPDRVLAAIAARAGLLLDLSRAEAAEPREGCRRTDADDLAAAVAAAATALAPPPPRHARPDVSALVRSLAIVAGGGAKAAATTSTSAATVGAAALARAAANAIAAACPAAAPPAACTSSSGVRAATSPATAGLVAGADPSAAAAFTAAVCVTLSAAPADLLSATAVVIAGEPLGGGVASFGEAGRPAAGLAAWLKRAVGCVGRPADGEHVRMDAAAPAAGPSLASLTSSSSRATTPTADAAWFTYGGAWAHANAMLGEGGEEDARMVGGPFWRRGRRSPSSGGGVGAVASSPAPPPQPPQPPPPPPALLPIQAVSLPSTCPVCMDAPPNVRAAPCGHALCSGCAGELLLRGGVLGPAPLCPFCRGTIGGVVGVVEERGVCK